MSIFSVLFLIIFVYYVLMGGCSSQDYRCLGIVSAEKNDIRNCQKSAHKLFCEETFWMMMALKNTDYSLCYKANSPINCHLNVAVKISDFSVCDLLPVEPKNMNVYDSYNELSPRDYCYSKINNSKKIEVENGYGGKEGWPQFYSQLY